MTRFDLLSPMTREEIARVLTDETDRWWTFNGAKPFVASVRADGFSMRVRQWYRNSFQTVLRATYQEAADGTHLSCCAGMHPFVVAFMVVWFAVITSIGIGVLVTVFGSPGDNSILYSVFAVVVMVAFGFALIRIGRWLAQGELERMLAFLKEVIDAERVG